MKVLHYSDAGEKNIKELFLQADVLFTTGDLSIFDLRPLEEVISKKPVFGVYGNHCVPGYMEKMGIIDVNLKVYKWNEITIGGFEGCSRYKMGGGPQFSEEEAKLALSNYPAVDILLLHAAPFGLLDTPGDEVHTGSKAVREYVDRMKPKLIFCGHDSPTLSLDYGGTKIFRTHGARIIEI
jgi:Icc-related predicted phosphoesterase